MAKMLRWKWSKVIVIDTSLVSGLHAVAAGSFPIASDLPFSAKRAGTVFILMSAQNTGQGFQLTLLVFSADVRARSWLSVIISLDSHFGPFNISKYK